jgi:hypothetical protein
MTQLTTTVTDGGGYSYDCFGLSGVTAGTQTVTVTATGAFPSGNSISFTGVTSVGTPATQTYTGSSGSQAVTLGSGKLIVQSFLDYTVHLSGVTGGTVRWSAASGGNLMALNTATATTTFNATISASDSFVGIAVILS